ncbi:hypothetical protein HY229_07965 [Candidatus Acetothermia bacterium]|nr:hypothetical protein [Candidatus Acetothermia bacterium]MBI3644015.1 hypothetical protein [Candidatus Acetothermia bacterium]
MKYQILSGVLIIAFVTLFGVPALGQATVTDQNYLAPGGNVEPGASAPMTVSSDAPATLGDGIVVSQFQVCDVDPLADDNSPVNITEFNVDNLGSASLVDITSVMIIDGHGFSVGAVATPGPPPNPNISWRATVTPETAIVIPDDQCEVFSVAVETATTSSFGAGLGDSQNHTLRLRTTLTMNECLSGDMSSTPPVCASPTTFVESSTDGAPEYICNCGVNRLTDDMYVVNPLMPSMSGVVSRFTVCDDDSNEHNLYLTQLTMKQGNQGSAEYTDFDMINVYRIESSGRTQIASFTPDVNFNRGGTGDQILAANQVLIITDDSCAVFEADAQVSQYAFKGRLIQLAFDIDAEEPRGTQIGVGGATPAPASPPAGVSGVAPEIQTHVPTPIGKGMITIPSTIILGSPGDIPLGVQGIPIPGLGTLQVGPTGAFHFDPAVIQILEIVGVGDYTVEAVQIDNRRGEARFTVRIDPAEAPNGINNGTVAIIRVQGVGKPGDRTRLYMNFDQVTDADNNVLADASNPLTLSNVGVIEGQVRLVPHGDVDGDGHTTVSDALLLADQLILGSPCAGLTDEQKVIADVAPPFADVDVTPTCSGDNPTLTSADVAQIAKLAITTAAAGLAASSDVQSPVVAALHVSQIQTTVRLGAIAFRAQGTGVSSMEVRLYSLTGRQILAGKSTGSQLMVHARDQFGKALANGVYLYVVTVHGVDGSVLRSVVKKLVILH